jgi:hypothetical protein
MTQQTLNLGLTGSVTGGDNLQILFTKSESNFIELYDHLANYNNPHETTAAQIGAVNLSLLGAANGVATLDSNGLLSASQAPSSSLPAFFTATANPTFGDGTSSTTVPNAANTFYGTDNQNNNAIITTGLGGVVCNAQLFSSGTSGFTDFLYTLPYFSVDPYGDLELVDDTGAPVFEISPGSLFLSNSGPPVLIISPGNMELSNNGPPVFTATPSSFLISVTGGAESFNLTPDSLFITTTSGMSLETGGFTVSDPGSFTSSVVNFVHSGDINFANGGAINFDNNGITTITSMSQAGTGTFGPYGLVIDTPTVINYAMRVNGGFGINAAPSVTNGGLSIDGDIYFNASNTLSNIGTIPGSVMYVSDDGGCIAYVNDSGASQLIYSALVIPQNLTWSSNVTISMSGIGVSYYAIATSNSTLTVNGASPGMTLQLDIKQDSTGSRIVTFPTNMYFQNGTAPVLSTAAGARDVLVGRVLYDSNILITAIYSISS